jgi:hypothetical protein
MASKRFTTFGPDVNNAVNMFVPTPIHHIHTWSPYASLPSNLMLIKSLDLSNTISLCIENRLGCVMQGPYSRKFSLFVMYEWAQLA